MWLEVPLPRTDYYVTWSSAFPLPHMEYSLAWSSASAQGIYWDLKFRSSASAYRILCDYGALKWRNAASAQGKYCDLEVTQFRFHTINLVRLEVSQFRFHTRALTFKSRNSPPHKEYPATWSSASAQGIYYVSKFSSSAYAHRTICDLKFLSLAQYTVTWISAVPLPQKKKDVIWNSALLLLHVNITFLWKIHSHLTTHPFLNFRDVLHDWWTLWRTEKQSNREAPGKSRW